MSNPTLLTENKESQFNQFNESPGSQRLGDTECPILFPPPISAQWPFKVLGVNGANGFSYIVDPVTDPVPTGQEDFSLDSDSMPLVTMNPETLNTTPSAGFTCSIPYYFDKGIWEFTFTFGGVSSYDNAIAAGYGAPGGFEGGGGYINVPATDYNNNSLGYAAQIQIKQAVISGSPPNEVAAYPANSPQVISFVYKSLCYFSLVLNYENNWPGVSGRTFAAPASLLNSEMVFTARKISDNTTADSAATGDSTQQI